MDVAGQFYKNCGYFIFEYFSELFRECCRYLCLLYDGSTMDINNCQLTVWGRLFTKKVEKSSKTGIMAHFKNITGLLVCNIIQSFLAFLIGDQCRLSTQMHRISNSLSFPCGELKISTIDQGRQQKPIGPIFKTSQLFYLLTCNRHPQQLQKAIVHI